LAAAVDSTGGGEEADGAADGAVIEIGVD